MIALSDKIAADGATPWSIAMGSGDATGWPGTDWVEDIMLRTVGTEVYDQWVNHEIPWTDPRVKKAWEIFGQIGLNEKYVFGGASATERRFVEGGKAFTPTPQRLQHPWPVPYDYVRNISPV
jgi:alpha-glucoside transport system substrate-binding protein